MPLLADATETAAANEALGHIRAAPILSISGGTDFKSNTCRNLFPIARDALLRRYPWNFAEARASLAASGEAPLFGFANSFPLPNNPYCLAVRSLPDATLRDKWRVSGAAIYTDLPAPLSIVYTARITDLSLWDALFRLAFGLTLGSMLAGPIARDREIATDLYQRAKDALIDAFPTDGAESNDDNEAPEQDIIAARR